jgi:hypothetical protein
MPIYNHQQQNHLQPRDLENSLINNNILEKVVRKEVSNRRRARRVLNRKLKVVVVVNKRVSLGLRPKPHNHFILQLNRKITKNLKKKKI